LENLCAFSSRIAIPFLRPTSTTRKHCNSSGFEWFGRNSKSEKSRERIMRKTLFSKIAIVGLVVGFYTSDAFAQSKLNSNVAKGNFGATKNVPAVSGMGNKLGSPTIKANVARPSAIPARTVPSKTSLPNQLSAVVRSQPKLPTVSPSQLRVAKPQVGNVANFVQKPTNSRAAVANSQNNNRAGTVSSNGQTQRGLGSLANNPTPSRSNANGQIGFADQSRFGGISGAELQERASIANGLRDLESIRNVIPDSLRESGIRGTTPNGPAGPDLRFGKEGPANGFQGRDLNNPLDRAGTGLTDIRGSSDKGRHGTRRDSGAFSSFGLGLATRGEHTSTTHIRTEGNNIIGSSYTADGVHVTVEFRDDRGRTTSYTDTWFHQTPTGSVRTVDTYDSHGRSTGSETIITNDDGSIQSKSVDENGNVLVTERDSEGNVTQYEVEATEPCDRSNGDIAMGGPIGPTVGDVIGMRPDDLLRQYPEGQSRGGENRMTSGNLRQDQVRPDANPNSGSLRNRVPVNPFGTISNPGPATGGGTGGGDRPN
jgi:hypothetical protein